MSSSKRSTGDALAGFMATASVRESPLKMRLRNETRALGGAGRMLLAADQAALLAFLVRLTAAKTILEVGTFTGYSTLWMAEALPAEGRILACDVSAEWTAIARRYWEEAGLADRIDLRLAPAAETLSALREEGGQRFDLAFIDADKESYPAYLEHGLALLRPGGLLVVDNLFWGGALADPVRDDKETLAIRATLARAADDPGLEHAIVPAGDGMLLVRKPL